MKQNLQFLNQHKKLESLLLQRTWLISKTYRSNLKTKTKYTKHLLKNREIIKTITRLECNKSN